MSLVVGEIDASVIVAPALEAQSRNDRIKRSNIRLDQLSSSNFYFGLILFALVKNGDEIGRSVEERHGAHTIDSGKQVVGSGKLAPS